MRMFYGVKLKIKNVSCDVSCGGVKLGAAPGGEGLFW